MIEKIIEEGFTQQEIAEHCGVTQPHVSRWLNYVSRIPAHQVSNLQNLVSWPTKKTWREYQRHNEVFDKKS